MRTVVLAAAVVLAAVGCGADADRASGDCLTAFRDAEPRAGAPYDVSPLDDAIKKCRTVDAWLDAWNRVPNTHPNANDAVAFLRDRCGQEELQPTSLCRDLASRPTAT